MTRSELDSFYRALQSAERESGTDAEKAAYYADLALEEERDDIVRVAARLAFRYAIEVYLAREDVRTRPARRLTRTERLQGLADRGVDTWEDYRGER